MISCVMCMICSKEDKPMHLIQQVIIVLYIWFLLRFDDEEGNGLIKWIKHHSLEIITCKKKKLVIEYLFFMCVQQVYWPTIHYNHFWKPKLSEIMLCSKKTKDEIAKM